MGEPPCMGRGQPNMGQPRRVKEGIGTGKEPVIMCQSLGGVRAFFSVTNIERENQTELCHAGLELWYLCVPMSVNGQRIINTLAEINAGENESCLVMSYSLQPCGLCSPWNSPGQNTGVGNLFLLQGIFPTRESNQGLLHCRWILYQLSYQGSPCIYKEIKTFTSTLLRSLTGDGCYPKVYKQ